MDRVEEEAANDCPTARGNGPGTTGGDRGIHTDQGGQTDGDEGDGGGYPPTTRGFRPGTPGGGPQDPGCTGETDGRRWGEATHNPPPPKKGRKGQVTQWGTKGPGT